jgi:protein-disulfide isomerase
VNRLLPGAYIFFSIAAASQCQVSRSDQMESLHRQIDELQRGQDKMQKALIAVMDILQGKKPPLENVFVRVADAPSLGRGEARVTIVEFTDFQCPFCGAYARQTLDRIIDDYVKPGAVRYVTRNFPLEDVHPLARKAAEAALCAYEQGKYWELHDRFFADQTKLTAAQMSEHAAAIGADPTKLRDCLDTGRYGAAVINDVNDGHALGVLGTPTFFVGYSDPQDSSRIRAVRSISGSAPYQEFQKAIAETLEASLSNKPDKR